ncbi:hydrogenase nickel incorporation protein HypA/HybF [Desulfonispora thiosulfatigenes DSM 11270]|uniref:Hydrogenase maturation factor HypA n=1 Tax=Desulfonispora thiosulfatigenes DSM 11270 TaxID=656914 RepID=A0A1W1VHJ0_DESTI|nr:hydrogenase maturation nickel metallochaperone HypA [Desulfonispora thiosulfatigenes]SMB92690.1 hydrogenase nickel incorporation protein HypA/HybF [Desulfonispora thiosulfatigenes DSM 11270]
MHELAIAQNLLDIVCKAAEDNSLVKVNKISIIAGEVNSIVPDALEFGFLVSAEGSIAEKAKIVYTELPAVIKCKKCEETFPWKENGYSCPKCFHEQGEMIQGNELYIDYIEGDEEDNNESN